MLAGSAELRRTVRGTSRVGPPPAVEWPGPRAADDEPSTESPSGVDSGCPFGYAAALRCPSPSPAPCVSHARCRARLAGTDRVAGAAHFETPVEVGRRLIEEMTARLPGYAVPKYVREVPGAPSKQRIA